MKYDEVVKLALGLTGTEESMYYGEPCVKRDGRFMFGLRGDETTISVKVDWDSLEMYLEGYPEVVYKTPHYDTWPAFLVRLEKLTPPLAESIVQAAWADAPKPSKRRMEERLG